MSLIDKNLWAEISPILDTALELSPADRRELVSGIGRERPALADALSRLLESHDRLVGSDFLASSPHAITDSRPSLVGHTLGAYTLEAPLGVGGMGTVWRARRSDGRYEGSVAVKVLNLALVGQAGDDRFRREGTILARLAHPHIARLLDAGVTVAGQPYLVLEFVEGTRLDRYADEHRLPAGARLELFLQVADAVAHAHASLIAHRDLKPSNVLVDRQGQVKLLDFGIGKLLEESLEDPSERTLVGGLSLTPEYAAPEQARGDAVTTAVDVYALGVLLHILLTGRHPTGASARNSVDHLRALAEREPERASDAVGSGDSAEARAALRGSTPARLRRQFRGDLDRIVVAALRKAPADRYPSVTALIDDVRRYLRHEPVSIRAPHWRYRAARFLRRHRIGVSVAGATAALLVTATAVATTQMLEARRQRDAAAFQARRAQASSEFMRYLVTQIGEQPMTMTEVLDRGRVALEQQYSGDPEFVARMLVHLSGPYLELGDYATVDAMMGRALELARTVGDADLLAAIHCGRSSDAGDQGNLDAARGHLTEARRQIQRIAEPSTGLLVECAISETWLARYERRFSDAVRHAEDAVRLLEEAGNASTTRYTSALSNLSSAYMGGGRFLESIPVHRKLIDTSRRIGRARTIGVVVALNNRAQAERSLGWWLTAERTTSEAIDLARGVERTGGVPSWLAMSHGRVLAALGRRQDATHWLTQTVEDARAAPAWVFSAQFAMAEMALDRADVQGARTLTLAMEQRMPSPPGAGDRIALALLQARIAAADGRLDDARTRLRSELETEEYPRHLSPRGHVLLELGARIALQAHDVAAAVRLAADAVRACDLHLGTEVPSALAGRARLTHALALQAAGRPAEAQSELTRALTAIESAAGAGHPWVQEARAALGARSR
jgi:serine/threonine-protein kinase